MPPRCTTHSKPSSRQHPIREEESRYVPADRAHRVPDRPFTLDSNACSVQDVIDQLQHLGLKWQVEDDPANGRKRALAPLYFNPATKEIWAVATVENWGSPRHLHNPAASTASW